MPSRCSHCNQFGHNIRTCTDPNIPLLWVSLIVTFVIPKIGSVFEERDDWAIMGFLDSMRNSALVRVAAIHYCGLNHGPADYLMHHYRKDFVTRLHQELVYVNGLTEEERTEWLSRLTVAEVADPDTVTFVEDRTPSVGPDHSRYPVVEQTMLCLETAEELAGLVECVICQEDKPKIEFNTTNCGHHFCHGCIVQHITSKNMQRAPCPLCRKNIETLEVRDSDHFENIYNHFSATAYILKECLNRVMEYQTPPSFEGTHFELISFIISELDKTQYDEQLSHSVYSQDTNLQRAEVLWRYLLTR